MIMKKKGGLRIKFGKTIIEKLDLHIRKNTFEAF